MEEIDIGKKIQTYRTMSKLSIRELSSRSGITPSMLSQIERDLANPSINTLKMIAYALDVPVYKFFQTDEQSVKYVVRSNERKTLGLREVNDLSFDLLTPTIRGNIEFCIMYVPYKHASSDTGLVHDAEEVNYVLEGQIDLIMGGTRYSLEKGDSVYIPANTIHKWENLHPETAQIILAITPPSY